MAVNAGTIYSEVRIALDKLKGDIAQVEANLDKFGKTNATQATAVQSKWSKSFGNINLAAVAAFAGMALAVKNTVKTFAKFEQSLANVRSVAQATPAEFAELERAALEAGETTRFTASQAADAMYYLASAGFDAKQSVAALNGVLLLAGSTQSDLAMTSETVAAAISQFNLEASDAERVANVFTAAITNSQATMEKLAVSMRYAGPVASAMGKSIEETAGVLQILYNNGFEASQAGTTLRRVMADLSNQMSPAVQRLKEMGINFDEINPLTNSFADIIDVLSNRVDIGAEGMRIFGQRAGPGMIKLVQAGREEIEKYTEAVTGTNAAAEAYAIQNDTLQGSIDLLKSAVESMQIKFTKELAPGLRDVVDILTQVVHVISNAPKPVKVFIGIVAAGIPIVIGLATAFKLLSSVLTKSTGIISAVVVAIGAAAAIASAVAKQVDAVAQIQESATASQEELKTSTDDLKKALDDLDAVQKKVKESTADMTEENKRALEEEEKRAQAVATAQLANQLIHLSKIEEDIAARKDRLVKEEQRYTRELKEAESVARMRYADETEINSSIYNQTQVRRDIIKALKQSIEDQTAAEADGILVLAEAVKAGRIRMAQIEAYAKAHNNAIAEMVRARIDDITISKEWQKVNSDVQLLLTGETINLSALKAKLQEISATRAQTAADEKVQQESIAMLKQKIADEESRIDAERTSTYNKRMDIVRSTIDGEKTKLDELREKLKEVEAFRGKTVVDEKARQQAILALRKNITKEETKAAEDKAKADEGATKYLEDYAKKLDELTKSESELVDAEHERAIEAIKASGASDEAITKAIAAVDEYYATLKDKTASDEFVKNMNTMIASIGDGFSGLGGALSQLWTAMTDARLDELDRQLKAELEAAGVAEESETERLEKELAEAKAAGDAETVLEKQTELKRAQITEDYEKKKAQVRYKGEMAQWGLTLTNAIAEAARAIVQAVASAPWPFNIPAIAFATVTGGIQLAAINAAKPQPSTFQTGGIVVGPEGTDRVEARLTAGEMVLTQEQQAALWNMIRGAGRQAAAGGGVVRFVGPVNINGEKLAEIIAEYYNNGAVKLD